MKVRTIFFISLYLICGSIYTKGPNQGKYLNTDLLKDIKQTELFLKQDGLIEYSLQTADGVKLSSLYKEHPHAQYTIIFYIGFLGIKEEAAPFIDLLADQPCNILLIDGRNKELTFNKLRSFGLKEHFDLLAAIELINKLNNDLPIFIHGSCAGAFFGIHALYHLQQQNKLKESNVKGLILDSSWGSRINISYHAPRGWALESLCKTIYGTKNVHKKRQEKILFTCLAFLIGNSYFLMHTLTIMPLLYFQETATNLNQFIQALPTPMLFIHAIHDHFAPFEEAKKLANLSPNATTWWIDGGGHSTHHLKYQKLYTQKLSSFINNHLNK